MGFQALPGRSRGCRGLQGPPGGSRGLQLPQEASIARRSVEVGRRWLHLGGKIRLRVCFLRTASGFHGFWCETIRCWGVEGTCVMRVDTRELACGWPVGSRLSSKAAPCFWARAELTHMRAAIALDKFCEGQVKSSCLGIYWAAFHSLAST